MTFAFTDWETGKTPPKGWDVADAVDDGWTKEQIDHLMRSTKEPWKPQAQEPKPKQEEKQARQEPANQKTTQLKQTQQEQPAEITHLFTKKTVHPDDNWKLALVCNDEGKIKPNVTKNWALFLENHPDMFGVFAFDNFKRSVTLQRRPPWDEEDDAWTPRTLSDRDYSEAVMWLEAFFLTPKASNIAAVIQTISERNTFDRLDEYLSGLKWDGVKRVASFIPSYFGCADDSYHRAVSTRWLVSAVARALKPGCKVDTMPVFEGPQGAMKSSALRALFGDEFFTDELSDIGSKDAMMEMQGVWCIEVAEMHRFNASDANQVKKFLTRQIDRYRPPYGRSVIEAPRRCLLGGTMNPEGNPYLKDSTGARRFWPVSVGKIDLEKIKKDRDQVWAEAVQLYLAGTPWWVQENEAVAVEAEQEKRIDVDVWTSKIVPLLDARKEISQWEIFENLGIFTKDASAVHAARVGRIMKRLGWSSYRDRKEGRDRTVYRKPEW